VGNGSTRSERTFVDVATGDTHVVITYEDSKATVSVEGHPLAKELAGKSWVTFVEKFLVRADGDPLAAALKMELLVVPGGTELEVEETCLSLALEGAEADADMSGTWIPVTIRDPYFPAVTGLALLRDLRAAANLVPRGSSPRSGLKTVECGHSVHQNGCCSCFQKRWSGKAAALSAKGIG
jgi:hypothetical protein